MHQHVIVRPIYDQNPDVWREFVAVMNACLGHMFTHHLTPGEQMNLLTAYQRAWEKYAFNFAFGAYDTAAGNRMVGFVQGQYEAPNVAVAALYVHPAYQDQGLGTSLLDHAEVVASLQASRVALIPIMNRSTYFYRDRGYARMPGESDCLLYKDLTRIPGAVRYGAFQRGWGKGV